MAISRYSRDSRIRRGTTQATASTFKLVQQGVAAGRIPATPMLVRGFTRLDVLAGRSYGDGRYWWAIAAASGIGWGLQVPPGTKLLIPALSAVLEAVQGG